MTAADELATIKQHPDFEAALGLLKSVALPTSDLTDAHMRHFFYIGSPMAPVGLVGVEFHGPDALLRSLVVTPEYRSRGAGARLVEHAERHARNQGAFAVYILTTTAERFFCALGYVAASREQAPVAIKETSEFSSLCPSSSAFLCKRL
jgi:amino-acid N-acetyltransferase